jgi:antitoxin VapB
MALNIKNHEVEQLATEVATLARETKTEAIRRSLIDRKQRLLVRRVDAGKRERLLRLLESRIWPSIPADVLGKPVSKEEKEAILGYGPEGF